MRSNSSFQGQVADILNKNFRLSTGGDEDRLSSDSVGVGKSALEVGEISGACHRTGLAIDCHFGHVSAGEAA